MSKYYDKYNKYKHKCNEIEKISNHFILHTVLPNKMSDILATLTNGIVDTGIYYEDLGNMPKLWGPTIILNTKLLYNNESVFYQKWNQNSDNFIYINENDNTTNITNKINRIKNYIKESNIIYNDNQDTPQPEITSHEIIIKNKLLLKDNMFGIVLPNFPTKKFNTIKKKLEILYPDKKIYNKLSLHEMKQIFIELDK